MAGRIHLRSACREDADFVFRLFCSASAAHLLERDDQQTKLLSLAKQQFQARRLDWERNYPNAIDYIVSASGEDIGRLLLNESDAELRIVEIALLPEWQGRGVGSNLMRDLFRRAEKLDVPIRLMVEAGNEAAIRFYERHDFRITKRDEIFLSLERYSL